jgi:hypothetical protein
MAIYTKSMVLRLAAVNAREELAEIANQVGLEWPGNYGTAENFADAVVTAQQVAEKVDPLAWVGDATLPVAEPTPIAPVTMHQLTAIPQTEIEALSLLERVMNFITPDFLEKMLDRWMPEWRERLPQYLGGLMLARRMFAEPAEARTIAREEMEKALKGARFATLDAVKKGDDENFRAFENWVKEQKFLTSTTLNAALRDLGFVTQASLERQLPDTATTLNLLSALLDYLIKAETDSASKRWLLGIKAKLETPPKGGGK